MRIIQDGLKFCSDCACWAANGDDSGIESDKRRKHVHASVEAFGPHLAYSDSRTDAEREEADRFECDSCGSECWGHWCEFAVLGVDKYHVRAGCRLVEVYDNDPARWESLCRFQTHKLDTMHKVCALLNAEPALTDLFDLVSELLDTHEAADQESDTIEAKCLHQLRKVRRMLGMKGEV